MRSAKAAARIASALFALAVALAGLSPAAARAQGQPFGQASVVGDVLTLEATPGTASKLQVNPKDADWRITDDHGPWVAGPGCTQDGAAVLCPQAAVSSLEAEAGDLEDHLRATVDIPCTLDMGEGGDQMRGGSVSDLLIGGPGDDNLEGRDAPDVLDGGEGRDTALYVLRTAAQPVEVTLDGVANDGGAEDGHADHILANVENVNATPGDDTLVGNADVNRMIGGDGADEISGGGEADSLFGQGGNDTMLGEAGSDALDGGDGADLFDGGSESDTAQYRSRTASQPVTVSLDGVADDGGGLDGHADNVLADVENVAGGAGADELTGGAGANSLIGNEGNDMLDGAAGPDSLEGGVGRDVVTYAGRGTGEPVVVSIDGAANDGGAIDNGGHDNVRTTVERVAGGAGDDQLTGSSDANTLTGNAGADTLTGGGGADTLIGGDGVDALAGAADRDGLDGGPGPDLLDGGAGRDAARYESRTAAEPITVDLDGVADDGGAVDGFADDLQAIESVVGGAGDDSLTGNAETNVLTGGGGQDELHGLAGNDELRASGDGFDDTITCGAGVADHVFADATDSFPVAGPDACEIVH